MADPAANPAAVPMAAPEQNIEMSWEPAAQASAQAPPGPPPPPPVVGSEPTTSFTAAVTHVEEGTVKTVVKVEFDALDERQVRVCNACHCCYDGLLCDDKWLGCVESLQCRCCEFECCCKMNQAPLGCYCFALRCCMGQTATSWVKYQSQCLCGVCACSLPPGDMEVPSMIALSGLGCKPSCFCCSKLGLIDGRGIEVQGTAQQKVAE